MDFENNAFKINREEMQIKASKYLATASSNKCLQPYDTLSSQCILKKNRNDQ